MRPPDGSARTASGAAAVAGSSRLPAGAAEASYAVAGASGYVGRLLAARLVDAGHRVRVLARSAGRFPAGPLVDRWAVDVGDADGTERALAGVETAYYLVHAMAEGPSFADRDRAMARAFAGAARRAGVGRLVYLGALGDDRADSEHLASRHEVGDILRASGVPVVELRAAVVIGAGSISFEMLRHLTERLPLMVCPRWVGTRIQPLAERDLLAHLIVAADVAPGIYELGSPDVTTYREMMQEYARVRGIRPRRIVTVPLLTPSLSAHWVDLVTPVDRSVSHALVGSLRHDVVVRDAGATRAAFGIPVSTVAGAIGAALADQAAGAAATLFGRSDGLADGIYTMRARVALTGGEAEAVRRDLRRAGGDLGWYGVAWAWRLRLGLGRLLGEGLELETPEPLAVGGRVDWWQVAVLDPDQLVLCSRSWRVGDAWLGFGVGRRPDGRWEVHQVAAFRPRGLPGLAYWRLLWPVHLVVLHAMVRHRRQRVRTRPRGRRTILRAARVGKGGNRRGTPIPGTVAADGDRDDPDRASRRCRDDHAQPA